MYIYYIYIYIDFKYIATNLTGGNAVLLQYCFSNIFTWLLKISKAVCYQIIEDTNFIDPTLTDSSMHRSDV